MKSYLSNISFYVATLEENSDGETYIKLPDVLIDNWEWENGDEIELQITDSLDDCDKHVGLTLSNLTKRKINKPYLDAAIQECLEEYEDEIELYRTYGGD
jgi:hypothetical protein|tara:strand:- start:2567 stop:2866 length:300 start_codon:yes stop_codon:yes gene_type:complete